MKILIYVDEAKLKPSGGVSGYCYNIFNQKRKLSDNEITFLKKNKKQILRECIKENIRRIPLVEEVFKKKYTGDEGIISYINSVKNGISKNCDYNDFDIIHFETTFDLYQERENLKKYKGLVLLTSHSPKVSYKEYAQDCVSNETYFSNRELFDGAEEFDRYAFERADYIIFPCPGAEEPYFHSWSAYKDLRDASKIRYVPTGVLPVECKRTREEVRKELGIPKDAIVLSFVGRHNEVKGYDLLQEIFNKLDNVYVVCCGKIGSIQPLKSDRWIEVGWTTDPYSYVGASDIYMLPNRETYFDIAMLQTLSIGKCSVISNTGGNKEFIKTPGVKLYNTLDEAVQCINDFVNISMEERKNQEGLQRKEFEEKYTIEVFYKKYKKTLSELIKFKEKSNEK